MPVDRLPSYDPSHGVLTKRAGRWVETWNLRNGVAWRDPVLAERAVAGWHLRHGAELREAETQPVLLSRLIRRLRTPSRVALPRPVETAGLAVLRGGDSQRAVYALPAPEPAPIAVLEQVGT